MRPGAPQWTGFRLTNDAPTGSHYREGVHRGPSLRPTGPSVAMAERQGQGG